MSDIISILLASRSIFHGETRRIPVLLFFVHTQLGFFHVMKRVSEFWALEIQEKYIYPTSAYDKISLINQLLCTFP